MPTSQYSLRKEAKAVVAACTHHIQRERGLIVYLGAELYPPALGEPELQPNPPPPQAEQGGLAT